MSGQQRDSLPDDFLNHLAASLAPVQELPSAQPVQEPQSPSLEPLAEPAAGSLFESSAEPAPASAPVPGTSPPSELVDRLDGFALDTTPSEEEPVNPGGFAGIESLPAAVVVVEADPGDRQRLIDQLGTGALGCGALEELVAALDGTPVIAVLGPSCAEPGELAVVEELLDTHTEVVGLLVTDRLSTELLQQALRAGVKDVLVLPIDDAQLIEAVERVAVDFDSPRLVAVPEEPSEDLGRVITVFSTKGGAGKSVTATNLALLLTEQSDRPVVLVDADLQFGDIAVMLKLKPEYTIVDAIDVNEGVDEALLDQLLMVHEPTGLRILPAPLEPAFADRISSNDMVRIIEVLRSYAGYVVVDTPAYFNDVVLGLIEVSDELLLVAALDVPNIKNVKVGLQTLRMLNTPMEKIRLILNRADSKVKLDVAEIERALGVDAEAFIPSDVVVPVSVNRGVPVVLAAPKSRVAKAFRRLTEMVTESMDRSAR